MSAYSPPVPQQPGWYPDPTGRFEARYCMRGRWTNRVRCGGAEAVDAHGIGDDEGAPDEGAVWQQSAMNGAGWAPDPTGRFDERWWDGQRFTRKIRWGHAVGTDTVSPPSSGAPRQAARQQGGERGPEPGWYPDPQGEGERFWDGHVWTAKWRAAPTTRGNDSMGGWMPQTVVRGIIAVVVLLLVISVVAVLAIALG